MDIAINTYSLRNEFESLGNKIVDIMIKLCGDLDVHYIEWLDRHVSIPTIKDDVKRFEDAGISVFSLSPHTKLLAKPDDIDKEIEDGKKWLNLAEEIGAKYIRVQLGDGPFMRAFPPMEDFDDEEWEDYNEQMEEAAQYTLKVANPLIEEAEKLGVAMGIETHHSYSSNYVYMEKLNKLVSSKMLGWIFDIGNYENDEMRWKGLEKIKDRTFYIHAKAYQFDEKGFETKLDYPRAAKILYDAGFRGKWSIEFEGKFNGILGVYRTLELVKYSIAKAKGEDYTIKTDFPSEAELMKRYTL